MITKFNAVLSLVPDARFGMRDGVITGWENIDAAQPTEEEIQSEVNRLQAVYDSEEWKRNRQLEYPSIKDQLDKIYHEGIDKWKEDMIKPVKEKYPK
jgi:hypothetical protein